MEMFKVIDNLSEELDGENVRQNPILNRKFEQFAVGCVLDNSIEEIY
jgi:hypothetical protein